jgi:hypothetical protein
MDETIARPPHDLRRLHRTSATVALPPIRLATIAAITLVVAGGSGSAVENADGTDDALTGADGWTAIGFGIGGSTAGSGSDILVTCGGYSARDQDSRAWAMALAQSPSFASLAIGPVYAARGPSDASYAGREIGNSKLAAALARQAGSARFVIVAAHSSGAFVADELITEASPEVRSKIVYFALDGGTHSLDDRLVSQMKAVYFVNAKDAAKGESHNASSMRPSTRRSTARTSSRSTPAGRAAAKARPGALTTR